MKLVLGLLAGLWSLLALPVLPAQAQEALVVTTCGMMPRPYAVGSTQKPTVNTSGAACTTGGTPAPPAFAGVLDVVPASPVDCWSFRACSGAIAAAGTQKLFQVQRTSDNNTCDFLVAHSGDVGLSTSCTMGSNGVSLATFLNATVGRLTKLYGQLGGYDFTTGVITRAPLIVLNCTGGKPCATADGTRTMTGVFGGSIADPISISAVAENTGASGFGDFLSVPGQFGFEPPNRAQFSFGATIAAPATDNQFHSVQVLTSASGHVNVDGVNTSGDTHTGGWTNGGFLFAYDGSATNALTGSLAELVAWGRANSTTDEYNLCTNQRAYWGTPVACVAPLNPQVLLLHCDGTNGSTTFTDSSGKGHVVTPGPYTTIGTSTVKFGTGACDSNNMIGPRYLSLDGSADFSFGTGDFTIDFWVYPTSSLGGLISTAAAHGTFTSSSYEFILNTSFTFYGGTSFSITSSSNPTLNAWNHVALVRASGVTTIYLNGTNVASGADTNNYANVAGGPVIDAAGLDKGYPLEDFLDEIRILKGQAAWTSNFTPPTVPYSPP